MKAFVKGDIDGFFALGLDSLICLLLMTGLCLGVLQFSPDLFFGRILPGTAVGLVLGNIFYARQALKLARLENRNDVCALPYGINLITIIAFSLLVMAPVQQAALASGLSKDAADLLAWHAGILACLGSGAIELTGAWFVRTLQRWTPRPALLASLACIGVFFIATDFLFRSYVYPLIGLTTLALTLVKYYGGVRFKWGIPGGLVVVAVGTLTAWGLYFSGQPTPVPAMPLDLSQMGLRLPVPVLGNILENAEVLWEYLPIIVPMGFINLLLSMQCIESAEAAGDRYSTRSSLICNGVGSLVSGAFGSPYPTCIYIGHPGWKAIGARAGYSTLNAIFVSIVCWTGTVSVVAFLIPIEAGMAILIWIGITMGTQAFAAVPKRHIPAVVTGILPGLGAYIALCLKHSAVGAGIAVGSSNGLSVEWIQSMTMIRGFFAEGAFALEQGFAFTCMLLGAVTVCIIDKEFRKAAIWCLSGALLSAVGLLHSFQVLESDVVSAFPAFGSKWVIGYLVMAAILLAIPYLTEHTDRTAEETNY